MTPPLAVFSDAIARLVASAAPMLAAIRIGPNRHLTGLLRGNGTIVTTDQALPALDSFTVVLSNRALSCARQGPRDPGSNLASLHLATSMPSLALEVEIVPAGSLAIVVGADADASPTVRLTVVHRFIRTADGPAPVLDLPTAGFEPGGAVLDATGRLIGLAALGPNGEAMAVPGAAIARLLTPNQAAAALLLPLEPATNQHGRRGWLGVTLQPITVPDLLLARAGQASGRMVVSINKGGPADMASMRVGDVLLSLNGTSASGPQTLRTFLGAERVGTSVEVRLLRDGNLVTTHLTVAAQRESVR
jgi:S1-C subfamily serine protease